MHQSFNKVKRRFYSTISQKSKLDEGVDLSKKAENYAKEWDIARGRAKVHYELKGFLKDINL